METSHAIVFMMMLMPPLITTVVVSANAKKINARWRERREARQHAEAGAK